MPHCSITSILFPNHFEIFHRAGHYYCPTLCKIPKWLGNWENRFWVNDILQDLRWTFGGIAYNVTGLCRQGLNISIRAGAHDDDQIGPLTRSPSNFKFDQTHLIIFQFRSVWSSIHFASTKSYFPFPEKKVKKWRFSWTGRPHCFGQLLR